MMVDGRWSMAELPPASTIDHQPLTITHLNDAARRPDDRAAGRVVSHPRSRPGEGPGRDSDHWYSSLLTTSAPERVTTLRRTITLVVSLRNFTEPSPKRTFAPPGW